MKRLFDIEKIKALQYPAFRTLLIIHFLLFILVVLVVSRIQFSIPGFSVKKLYQFPNIWEFVPWIASWFNLFLAIIVILLVGNEFTHRTFRQNVIDGLSRTDLIKGKLIIITSIAIYTFLLVLVVGIAFGLIYSDEYSFNLIFGKFHVLLIYFVQAMAYMIMGMMVAILFRNNALSIIMFILYFAIIEPIIRWVFPAEVRRYFPMKIISNLTPTPEFLSLSSDNEYINVDGTNQLDLKEIGITIENLPVVTTVALAVVYIGIFIYLTNILLKKKSL